METGTTASARQLYATYSGEKNWADTDIVLFLVLACLSSGSRPVQGSPWKPPSKLGPAVPHLPTYSYLLFNCTSLPYQLGKKHELFPPFWLVSVGETSASTDSTDTYRVFWGSQVFLSLFLFLLLELWSWRLNTVCFFYSFIFYFNFNFLWAVKLRYTINCSK